MKKIFFLIGIFLLTTAVNAQKTKVSESTEKIADGKYNCLVVTISEADDDDVIKAWKDKMKDTGAKVSGKSEMFADDATITSISSNTIDVYSIIEEKDGSVKFIVAFNLGGAYLNSRDHASGYKAAEKMVYDFAVSQAKEAVNKQLAVQQGLIKDTEKKIGDLTKDNEKMARDIEDYKKRIEEAEKSIETNKSEIENSNKALEEQNAALKELEKKLNAVD